ncbi:MAG: PorP/SprF family type IX secretion system membrane protein [Bacteroidetes bacterium]|nr:PorP/SprF family type IX secretion system membrane protein [Bacteroidota bacterium]
MKHFTLTFSLVFVFTTNTFAQDVAFANTNQSLLNTNPSFAGSNGGLRVQTNYQNKWPNISAGHTSVSYYASADAYVKKIKGAFALNYGTHNEAKGLLTSQNIGLTYAQHFKVNDKLKIIPSLRIAYLQRRLEGTYMLPGWYPHIVTNPKKQALDFSSGLLFQYKTFYGGVSAFHVNQPDEGLLNHSKLPVRLNVHASYNFILSEKMLVQVGGNFTSQQKFQSLQLQTNAVFFKHFICGLNFINADYFGGVLGYRHDYFSATVNYFASVSRLAGNTAGSWELALSYNLRDKDNRKKLTAFEAW